MNAIEVSGLTKRYGRGSQRRLSPGTCSAFWGSRPPKAIAGWREAIWLFEQDYDEETLVMLFVVVWLLTIGLRDARIFISTSPATRARSSLSYR